MLAKAARRWDPSHCPRRLRHDSDAIHESGKPWIRAKRINSRKPPVEPDHVCFEPAGCFEPAKSRIGVAKARVDYHEGDW